PYLQIVEERQVLHKVFVADTPGKGSGRKRAPPFVFGESGAGISSHRHVGIVAVLVVIADATHIAVPESLCTSRKAGDVALRSGHAEPVAVARLRIIGTETFCPVLEMLILDGEKRVDVVLTKRSGIAEDEIRLIVVKLVSAKAVDTVRPGGI